MDTTKSSNPFDSLNHKKSFKHQQQVHQASAFPTSNETNSNIMPKDTINNNNTSRRSLRKKLITQQRITTTQNVEYPVQQQQQQQLLLFKHLSPDTNRKGKDGLHVTNQQGMELKGVGTLGLAKRKQFLQKKDISRSHERYRTNSTEDIMSYKSFRLENNRNNLLLSTTSTTTTTINTTTNSGRNITLNVSNAFLSASNTPSLLDTYTYDTRRLSINQRRTSIVNQRRNSQLRKASFTTSTLDKIL
ncbi:unnamed protein product [Didymodactylos carnosus]|uniref:Uncharacterized protein n=1 Tax=Didymodactylos carnosus TaxID=1234261 RepID=A0A814JBF8_9BILA|nr:unnamed protein product [Didymodactylos carnosus]CAF1034509.1 unnamed protein product [Didymodactylos carnosus]CAF3621830.1 unnamed protein product [Didymodactylos carnosus]CAF3805176.1 unnamed protein product [Didymodactylos carnosus]